MMNVIEIRGNNYHLKQIPANIFNTGKTSSQILRVDHEDAELTDMQ